MTRKELEALGLPAEQIDSIMTLHGKSITAEQDKTKAANATLTEVREQLKAFDGVDVAELKSSVAALTADLGKKETEYAAKIADIEFKHSLQAAVAKSGARNEKAVLALLDVDALKASKNQETDISAALELAKKENDYLFGDSRVTNRVTGFKRDENDKTAAANEALRVLAGKGE